MSYLYKASVKENLFYWKILREEDQKSPDLLTLALSSRHPEVRQWIVPYLPKEGSYTIYIEQLCQDKALRVRYAALRSIPSELREKYRALFHQALTDQARKIREYSRFVLSRMGPQDFRGFYQEKLSDSQQSPPIGALLGPLLGWIEVSQPEDREAVLKFLGHPSSKVRVAAFQAIARLESSKTPEYYLLGIKDPNAKVRRVCIDVLKRMAGQVREEMTLLLENSSLSVQKAALEVLSAQSSPRDLESILYALTLPDKPLEAVAWKCLTKWYAEYGARPYFYCSLESQSYAKITNLCKTIEREKEIPPEMRNLWGSGLPSLLTLLKTKK